MPNHTAPQEPGPESGTSMVAFSKVKKVQVPPLNSRGQDCLSPAPGSEVYDSTARVRSLGLARGLPNTAGKMLPRLPPCPFRGKTHREVESQAETVAGAHARTHSHTWQVGTEPARGSER